MTITAFTDIANCALALTSDGTLWQDNGTTPATADTNPIGRWDDASGNSNHATASGTARPLFKTNILNGYPAVRFDGVNDILALTTNLTGTSHTVFALVKMITGASSDSYFGLLVASQMGIYVELGGASSNWGEYANTNIPSGTALADGTWYRLTGLARAANDIDLVTNGSVSSNTTGASWQSRASTAVGADPSGAQFAHIDLIALAFYTRALTTAERQDVERFIRTKYQVATPGTPTGLTATALSPSKVHLRWQGADVDELSFRVERAPDVSGSPGSFSEIGSTAAEVVDYIDTGLTAGTKYYYKVRARGYNGDSSYSSNASVTTDASVVLGFTREVSGALYLSEPTWTGWAGDSQWAITSHAYFVCYPTGYTLLSPSGSGAGSEQDGVREGQLYVESGTWRMLYDSGDGTNGWRQYFAHSDDRGYTWTKDGAQSIGLNKVSSGTWAAVATGWVAKHGSTYYMYRVTTDNVSGSPNVGLPAPAYKFDCWTGSAIGSITTPSAQVPVDVQYYHGGGSFSEFLPGSVFKDGSNYYEFCQGQGTGYQLGIHSAVASPEGPFDGTNATVIASASTTGFDGRTPENPRVFYSSTLTKWCCLTNLITTDSSHTDANAVGISTSISSWGSAEWRKLQQVNTLGDYPNAVGVISHITGPDAALVEGPAGQVPVIYDGNPVSASPNWHLARKLKGAVLFPITAVLRCTQLTGTTYRKYKAISHGDCMLQASYMLNSANASTHICFQIRSDQTGANCYQMDIFNTGIKLTKIVGSTPTVLITGTGAGFQGYLASRATIIANANRFRLYLDGENLVDYIDSSSPIMSGGYIAVTSVQADVDLLLANLYVQNAIRFTGATGTVKLRSYGALPVDSAVASGGLVTFSHANWPHQTLENMGTDYTASNALYGGDVLSLQSSSIPVIYHQRQMQGMC